MDAKKVNLGTDPTEEQEEFVSEVVVDEEKFTPISEESGEEKVVSSRKWENKVLKRIQIALLAVVGAALWLLIGYLLGIAELPFGAVFLGIALLCAASSKVGYVYTGLIISAILSGEGALVSICA